MFGIIPTPDEIAEMRSNARDLADMICAQSRQLGEDDGQGRLFTSYVEELGGPNGPKAAAIMRAMVQAANNHESQGDMPERMYDFLKANYDRMKAEGGPGPRMEDAVELYNRTVKVEG
ncbi:hypothetical protein [Ruixingdingia sedimenti]|uniref:Uncharacterized protein n=1 Tax=Ruixingdingia sedimenti TaxID=3073604 RepID=A0ABU1FC64_9RHOB|nr:hypothetical protein [Xinfangfangia sp. LG-4]MDR5654492.1 hypothetical protein [Xinfangfangia sp. LG-4]